MCFFRILRRLHRKKNQRQSEVPFLNPYYCKKCKRSFPNIISYEIHMKNH